MSSKKENSHAVSDWRLTTAWENKGHPEGCTAHHSKAAFRFGTCGDHFTELPNVEQAVMAEQLASAHIKVERVRQWARRNPQAFGAFESHLLGDASNHRRASACEAMERVRRVDYVDVDGEPSRLDNNDAATLSRIVCERHPEVMGFVRMRASDVDVAFPSLFPEVRDLWVRMGWG